MRALILESFVGSNYADSPDSYEFPPQYLRFFEPLSRSESVFAVIYEPRGDQNLGRVAYVGWTLLQSPPEESGRRNERNQVLFRVRYAERYREFDRIVPREATGEPIETWLRALPRGRERNVATFGRAVRDLLEDDLRVILSLGFPNGVARMHIELPKEHAIAEALTVEERAKRLVSAVQREARFRDDVLASYSHRCAISGFEVGTSPSRAFGLLDAAHIRPVGSKGADVVANGLALTPSVHRLFDKGLFTLAYRGNDLVVRASPQLRPEMVRGRRGFELRVETGMVLSLPAPPQERPAMEALEYHQSQVFLSR
jgi:putative restriction endonuclease